MPDLSKIGRCPNLTGHGRKATIFSCQQAAAPPGCVGAGCATAAPVRRGRSDAEGFSTWRALRPGQGSRRRLMPARHRTYRRPAAHGIAGLSPHQHVLRPGPWGRTRSRRMAAGDPSGSRQWYPALAAWGCCAISHYQILPISDTIRAPTLLGCIRTPQARQPVSLKTPETIIYSKYEQFKPPILLCANDGVE